MLIKGESFVRLGEQITKVNLTERLDLILTESWQLFKAHCLYGRAPLHKEASFQHNFANIIEKVGTLYCFTKTEAFYVDLEYSIMKQTGFNKKVDVDIICELRNFELNEKVKAAIELKHTIKPGDATDIGRIGSYQDIHRLELLKELKTEGFDLCKFYMLANRKAFTDISQPETSGEDFPTYDSYVIKPGKVYSTVHSKVGDGIQLKFKHEYKFVWDSYEQPKRLYFLSVDM
ncbi:hypothetical protein ACFPES_12525 [Paenibacillus sp. GCM10023248]|uniref:hypothetical protein n=1 Tax=unclassified Paenibacillus TaxID=185978 RepID=UPI00237902C7|nr:hypothetical protein [Paenibacillus sp. MAHUQ-63]MDD9267853.1 hypothetical protein [Paenibacillus sp. MAHUQ-63]